MNNLKKIISKYYHKIKSKLMGNNPDGYLFYDPSKKMTFQSYFLENKEEIFKGNVPNRYNIIANLIPGSNILEIGSADGTQSLVLAKTKNVVYGIELMPEQYETANLLKKSWIDRGIDVSNCHFINDSALNSYVLLNKVDTVFMSRVIYHLRSDIFKLFELIEKSSVEHVVLVGCPKREANWLKHGDAGDIMGKYAFYASTNGMEEILKSINFEIIKSIPSAENQDPIVIGKRLKRTI